MSWNKNTISMSEIDSIMGVLKEMNIDFKCEEIGKVRGCGLNDYWNCGPDEEKYYSLRKLAYDNFIILEQIIRANDCDIDDIITSSKFDKDKEPSDWEIEIVEEEDEDDYFT